MSPRLCLDLPGTYDIYYLDLCLYHQYNRLREGPAALSNSRRLFARQHRSTAAWQSTLLHPRAASTKHRTLIDIVLSTVNNLSSVVSNTTDLRCRSQRTVVIVSLMTEFSSIQRVDGD